MLLIARSNGRCNGGTDLEIFMSKVELDSKRERVMRQGSSFRAWSDPGLVGGSEEFVGEIWDKTWNISLPSDALELRVVEEAVGMPCTSQPEHET